MSCDCIEKIEKKFIEDNPDKHNPRIYKNLGMGDYKEERALTTLLYKKKSKSGEVSKKDFEFFIVPNFCPFCGVPYGDNSE